LINPPERAFSGPDLSVPRCLPQATVEEAACGKAEGKAQQGTDHGSLPDVFAGLGPDVELVTDSGAEFGKRFVEALSLFDGLHFENVGGHLGGDPA